MKIAILCPSYFYYEGLAKVVEEQVKEYCNCGNEVSIFCLASKMESCDTRVKVNVLGMPRNYIFQKIYRILFPFDIIKAVKWVPKLKTFDVIYSYEYPLHWYAYLSKRLYHNLYIVYFAHLNKPAAYTRLIERIYMKLRLLIELPLIKKADKAISISKYSSELLMELTGMDSEIKMCKIDGKRFHQGIDGRIIRHKYGLQNKPIILFVGRITPPKNINELIKIYFMVKESMPKSKLVLIGDDSLVDHVNELKAISDDSVLFIGAVPDEEIPYFYASCDVYATASMWEGFNLPLAEAIACGKPVVAFDIGPHPEIVNNGTTGILVPPGNQQAFADAILYYLNKSV